ncbi:hypothetical protein D3C81_1675340 [compost metagenome]
MVFSNWRIGITSAGRKPLTSPFAAEFKFERSATVLRSFEIGFEESYTIRFIALEVEASDTKSVPGRS